MRLSQRVLEIEESATLAVSERAAALRAQGVDVIPFAAGEPDFDTPEHIKQAAVDAMKKGLTKYTASSGIAPLRKAVAKKYEKEMGLAFDPAQVLISTGAKHSLYNAMHALLDPGDEVIIPAPFWVSYPEMVKTTGARPVIVETDEASGFKLTPEALSKKLTSRTRALIFCSPSNPTGTVHTEAEIRAIAEVVQDRDLIVLSDEVYEKMVYGRARHFSIARASPKTLIVNSCSKTYAMTGWRLGFMVGPKEIIAAAGKIQSQSTSNANSIAQYAALAALEGDQTCVSTMIAEYARRRDFIIAKLRGLPGVTCGEPEGAFYAFPNVKGLYGRTFRGSGDFAAALLDKAHIAVVPGGPFGSDAHVRISYATSTERIAEGVNRFEKFIRERL